MATDVGGELPDDRLWGLYDVALEEYRFNVTLGADRQKFYLGLNLAVSSVVATLGRSTGLPGDGRLASIVLFLAALTALLGILAVERSHEYYRNARSHFQLVEDKLGLQAFGLRLRTTAGMSGEQGATNPEDSSIRVYRLAQVLLGFLALADVLGAIWLWP